MQRFLFALLAATTLAAQPRQADVVIYGCTSGAITAAIQTKKMGKSVGNYVALSEPVDLLRELEARCDLEFEVRRASHEEIVLDVGDAA